MPGYPSSEPTAAPLIFHSVRISLFKTFSQQMWDETFQRVTNEQEIYEGLSSKTATKIPLGYPFVVKPNYLCLLPAAQLQDLMQLKQENTYLTTITRQISPYILSIAKVKERLEPRCCVRPQLQLFFVLLKPTNVFTCEQTLVFANHIPKCISQASGVQGTP